MLKTEFRNLLRARISTLALYAGLLLGVGAVPPAWTHQLPTGLPEKQFHEMRVKPQAVGSFQLTDQHGQAFDQSRLKGRWHLVMFGFTSCPDVCPVHMTHLAGMRKKLVSLGYAESALPVVALVTVDPKRDTADRLGAYVRHFHEEFLGVTGSQAEIGKLEKSLGGSHRTFSEDVDGHYDVLHTSSVYAINPQGELVAKIAPPFNAEKLAAYFDSLQKESSGSASEEASHHGGHHHP